MSPYVTTFAMIHCKFRDMRPFSEQWMIRKINTTKEKEEKRHARGREVDMGKVYRRTPFGK